MKIVDDYYDIWDRTMRTSCKNEYWQQLFLLWSFDSDSCGSKLIINEENGLYLSKEQWV